MNRLRIAVGALLLTAGANSAWAQCSQQQIQNFTGTTNIICPCFGIGEQAGAVFTAPAGDYPLEILRVGIAWGSQFGGTPASLQRALHVYQGGLPDPGSPIFTLDGPVLNDGVFNQFDLEPLPGQIIVPSGPFTVALEFLTANSGNPFAPSVANDGNGCLSGKNLVYAVPGGWTDACGLGISGDWLFFVIYRPCIQSSGVGDETRMIASAPLTLLPARPNPSRGSTEFNFVLGSAAEVTLAVHDIAGRRIALIASGGFSAGPHHVVWDGRMLDGRAVPSGLYFAELIAGGAKSRRSVLVTR